MKRIDIFLLRNRNAHTSCKTTGAQFLYYLIKINNKKKAIVSLTLHDGSSTTDSLNISHEFVQYVRDLLGVLKWIGWLLIRVSCLLVLEF